MQGVTAQKAVAMTSDEERQRQFQALLAENRGIVLKVAYTYSQPGEDCEDLIQDIAVQLWRSFPGYDPSRKFSTWMYRVALNVAISNLRRTGQRNPKFVSIDGEDVPELAAPEAPESDERIAFLNQFISQQDPLNRALLLLYLEEYSYREIADVLGISETNVATKISRLKQRIRQEMEKENEK